MTKYLGRARRMAWAYCSQSQLRASRSSRFPRVLNPWHGGPPMTTSMPVGTLSLASQSWMGPA